MVLTALFPYVLNHVKMMESARLPILVPVFLDGSIRIAPHLYVNKLAVMAVIAPHPIRAAVQENGTEMIVGPPCVSRNA